MPKRYKVIEVIYKTKTTLEKYDPTLVRKNLQIKTVSYHNTLQQATKKIDELEEKQQMGFEMDRSFGAPSECFDLISEREWYIVDTKTGFWYDIYSDYMTEESKIKRIKKPEFDFGRWMM